VENRAKEQRKKECKEGIHKIRSCIKLMVKELSWLIVLNSTRYRCKSCRRRKKKM
jgi:hypothetical protein